MSPVEADELAVEYTRFLQICATNMEVRFPVSAQVDEFWHAHMLYSKEYREMCEEVFGALFNHNPVTSEEQRLLLMPDYINNTLPTYERMFGQEPSQKFWPKAGPNAAICTGDSDNDSGDDD
ncbi:MAG: hypothetical protein AAB510_03455 [Patescibacteria group bacterium]